MPAKTLKTGKDTIVSRAVAAVSETLLQEVTELFKRLFKIHYEPQDELARAPEWKELERLFCESCDAYTSIAINNRSSLRGELFTWVEEKIKVDEDAITAQHFCCHPDGRLVLPENYDLHDGTWRVVSHLVWMNHNFALWVVVENIARAKATALRTQQFGSHQGGTSCSVCEPQHSRGRGRVRDSGTAHSFCGPALEI